MLKVKMNWEKMVKMAVLHKMVNFYNAHAYTHEYMLAFTVNGNIVVAIATAEMLIRVCCLDKASRGAGNSLRFKPNMAQKNLLMRECETFVLCSVADMETLVESTVYNKGEIVEKLITEYYGQTWEKDNIPFTDDGDITVDNIAYQIKFEKATFINEKGMASLMAQPFRAKKINIYGKKYLTTTTEYSILYIESEE